MIFLFLFTLRLYSSYPKYLAELISHQITLKRVADSIPLLMRVNDATPSTPTQEIQTQSKIIQSLSVLRKFSGKRQEVDTQINNQFRLMDDLKVINHLNSVSVNSWKMIPLLIGNYSRQAIIGHVDEP